MDMNEVVSWLKEFVQREYEAHEASHSPEMDDETHRRRFAALDMLYALETSVHIGISRTRERSDAVKARAPGMRARMVPRVLFLLKSYAHPELGPVYRAYVGGEFKHNANRYNSILNLAQKGDSLRVISVESLCGSCRGSGKVEGQACPECGGKGWENASGMKIGELGQPLEVRKLQAPMDPTNRADYESA